MPTFRATVELGGKTATGFEVPEEVVTGFGAGRRPAVRVTLGGHSYPSTVAVTGGRFMVPLSAENRTAAGLAAGDEVDVELELDTCTRELVVPEDMAAAIAADPGAQRFFDTLSYSNRRRHVLSVEGAKSDATRQRRIARVVEDLRAEKK